MSGTTRLLQFTFLFDDGVLRTFWALSRSTAEENAKTWGRAHGGLTVR